MRFSVTILGSNSAIPTASRHPTSQLINYKENYYLIDCGEGTQIQLRRQKAKFQRIERIFISHLHGDHIYGLIGLISTMQLLGREKPLIIHAHQQLKEIINLQLKLSQTWLQYPLLWEFLPDEPIQKIIFENHHLQVEAFPLEHRIACYGFKFTEKHSEKRIKKEALEQYRPALEWLPRIKAGEDFLKDNGELIPNNLLTEPPLPERSYVFCTDTLPLERNIAIFKDTDLLYHEATFTEEFVERSSETYHSTAKQAAALAQSAQVKKLIIGHFSARYSSLEPLLNEAKEIFENTELAIEGVTFEI